MTDPGHDPSDIRIIHEDERFVVVDKPAGLLSVPGRGHDKADCVASRVLDLYPAASGPMIVHRLDMDTSGLIVLGLDRGAQRHLSVEFQKRRVEKHYIALVDGSVESEAGEIDLPLRVDWPNRPRQIVCFESGKPAVTRFRVLARETDRTRLRLEPVTGRTHQLRVHMADPRGLGRPILGDTLYAMDAARDDHPRLMLHAAKLCFRPPGKRKMMDFVSQPPF
ncbi:MAG TPA: RluA family pseudouridine synthase [Phycisphaerales bacterium]|nr:RluA family pseudouridine synthase [Phycisphaerales bacterium]